MVGTSLCRVVSIVIVLGACGTGDNRIDPGDLELRDLLGVAPEVANGWDVDQRSSARRVLVAGLEARADPIHTSLETGATLDERVIRTLAVLDGKRFAEGTSALGVVRAGVSSNELVASVQRA